MILSVFQANELLQAHRSRLSYISVSLDLGKTKSDVIIKGDRFIFPGGISLSLKHIEKVLKKDTSCFIINDDALQKVEIFSEYTNNYYKLVPTRDWPTLEISGIRMHCTKDIGPKKDTEQKISFAGPCEGNVLDTCTGLGYTAIAASRTASCVHTFERDEAVVEIEKVNPWSDELFGNEKIIRHEEDVYTGIKQFDDSFFDSIIHDPPRYALSPEIYTQKFYNELFRAAKQKCRIYHYTGTPGSKKRGLDLQKSVLKRLGIAGFSDLKEVFNGVSGLKK